MRHIGAHILGVSGETYWHTPIRSQGQGHTPIPSGEARLHKDRGTLPYVHKDRGTLPYVHKDRGTLPDVHKDRGTLPDVHKDRGT